MNKRFNILVINSDRIDSFINNFKKKIINFDKKIDFITLLDCSLYNNDIKKFKFFSKKNKIKHFIIKRNTNALDHGARLEFFTQIHENKKFHSRFIFQLQDNYLDTGLKSYKDGSRNFDTMNKKKNS